MKLIFKLEELALFILSIYAFSRLPLAWWWFPLLLLLPDVGMLGYLVNNRIGAFTYNLLHSKLLALLLFGIGIAVDSDIALVGSIILFAHASMDRFLGYGLKYSDSFRHTHLGKI